MRNLLTGFAAKKTAVPAPEPSLLARWTKGAELLSKAISVVLGVALVAGPAALVIAGWTATRPVSITAATVAAVDTAGKAAETAAGEFAQRAVVLWLGARQGDEKAVSAVLPLQMMSLPAQGVVATNPAIAVVVARPDGVWSVTVAVTVGSVRRFFQLPVRVSGGAVVALSLPAEVAGPALGASTPLSGYVETLPLSSPVAATVSEFLAALLTGSGDVTRYITPGASIVAVQPAPYMSVTVSTLLADRNIPATARDGDQLQVLVTATGVVNESSRVGLSYPLMLTLRASRWEVSAILPAPILKPATAQSSSATVPGSSTPIAMSTVAASATTAK